MKTKIEECTELKPFTVRCMNNEVSVKEHQLFLEHWEQAESISEFKRLVFSDHDLATSQGYAELSKESEGHWYRIREMFGNRTFKIESDAGSVKVTSADGTFSILVPNGYGDCTTRCAVFTKGEPFNSNMMKFTGIELNGNMNIMNCDCCDGFGIAKKLSGRYGVYYYEGLVAFEQWSSPHH